MGLSENSDDHIFKRHNELCNTLNMDAATNAEAWVSYESIKKNYTLEGDPLHWLGCSIYVACRIETLPTVGQTGSVVKGNCVSLTRLLRLCNLSLTQFFSKSKKWADMANMPAEFRKRIDRLERNFAVSCVVFKKFHVIFNEIFLTPAEDQPKQHRSRKHRNLPCTPARVFEFCWTLFVCIKGEFATCSDDLVTSFHLLLACCDMAFSNALLADRRDLLNPNFSGLPDNWSSPDYVKPTEPPCIIDILCQLFYGIVLEAKWVKQYSWKQAVNNLFDKNILYGDPSTFAGLFDPVNFDMNMKAVNKVYEEHVLNVGEFDEKIFLAEYRRMQLINKQAAFGGVRSALRDLNTDGDLNATIGSPNRGANGEDKSQIKRSNNLTTQYDDQIQQLFPATPLTGRRYLRGKDGHQKNAPLTTATQSVIRLQTLLAGRQPEPNGELKEIFSSCSRDPSEAIKNRIREMGDKFRSHYTQQTADQPNGNVDFANKRLTLSETLYYKLLENVVQEERLRNPNLDVTNLLEQDIFHRCMFACSIEIVIYSYNCQRKFPWILQALDLKAYYFYRVIELIVRTKDQLSRDVVKHLNSIEEQILESIAWESDSPLWHCIEVSNRTVPSCEDTALPGHLDDGTQVVKNPNLKKFQTPLASAQQSPVSTAAERFQSPISGSVVKKKLFVDQTIKVKPGQSLLQTSAPSKTVAIVLVDEKGNKKLIPISDLGDMTNVTSANPSSSQHAAAEAPKPRRNGSLALFFRKFYNLAGVRMEELCNQLSVTDTELKRKIFTCFEHCIIENTDLMKDRHLDQILMCAVYVVCKVLRNEKTFTEIMRCYRLQPQADSHVYRSVLMHKTKPEERNDKSVGSGTKEDSVSNDAPVKRANPGELAGTSTTHDLEDRGDLIKFYNTVYIQRIQNFALRFSNSQQSESLHLSPLPVTKHLIPSSPKRRVTDNVYVRPLDQIPNSPPDTVKQYSYFFSRSPSKDLQNINILIKSRVGGKRLLTEDDIDEDVTPIKKAAPLVTRKLHGLIEERLGQTKE